MRKIIDQAFETVIPLAAIIALIVALFMFSGPRPNGAAESCTAAPTPPPAGSGAAATWFSDGRPPARFRADARVRLSFGAPAQVSAICSHGLPPLPCGSHWLACTVGDEITVPNPCAIADDPYAAILCHELGHVNGWPPIHGE